MTAIPIWLLGKHVTAVTVTPQTVSTAGVLTPSTPVETLVGFWDEIDITSENTLENIQSADQRRDNNVITGTGTTVRVVEILKTNDSSATPTNLLATLFYGSADYYQVTLTRGGRSFSFYGVARSYNEGYRRGKSVATGEFAMVDPGASNPTYT